MCRSPSAIVFHTSVLLNLLVVADGALRLHSSSLQQVADGSRREKAEAEALGAQLQKVASDVVEAGGAKSHDSQSMRYLLRTLDKFKSFAENAKAGVEERHTAEEQRLQASIGMTQDADTQLALKQSITSNAESLLETERVYNNMVGFADSMEGFLSAATSKGYGCEQVTCGPHASCTETTLGAECICNEGYVGNGRDCAAPAAFIPHHLLHEGQSLHSQARDVHVAIFGPNNVAVVYSDAARGGMGRTVVGNIAEAGTVVLSPPDQFTRLGEKAFSPVVSGTDGNRLLITWRDQNTEGLCWMRGAALGVTGIRGAEQHISWTEPMNFCRHQSHKMALVSMPNNRVIVLFADKVKATAHTPAQHFGNSMIMDVGAKGELSLLGKFQFSDFAVCRLEVTKLSLTSFVIAARGAQVTDDLDSSVKTGQEAIAIFGEASGDDLVYDPNTLNLAPSQTHIWARGLSLIAPNTFAYSYQEGKSQKIMMAIVKVDEVTHRMQVVNGPSPIREGVSPYVSMLSLPYTVSDPHTLTYFQGDTASMVNVCSWSMTKNKLKHCEDFSWLDQKLSSVAGVHLGGGKAFMVFAPESGMPYYAVFGLSKK